MDALQELRLGLRSLTRTPGYYALALVTLSLGIGATAVLFSITESVLWRPFSFADAERLVQLNEFNPKVNPLGNPVSGANFLDWRGQARSFAGLAAMTYGETHSLTGAGERVRSQTVTAGFFETLRVQPAKGRTFAASEEQSAGAQPVILADAFWRRYFGGVSDILGRQIKLDGDPYTVVGVLPAGFRLEFLPGVDEPDLFLPLHPADPKWKRSRRALMAIGRLGPGASSAQAAQEMSSLAGRLSAEHPEDAGWTVNVENLRVAATKSEGRTLYLFLGFAFLVLLIACANVAGLQFVRFTGRRKEYALRLSLGARRGTLLRQALAENAWIAIPGGAAGALLASWGIAGVRALLPTKQLARSEGISLDAGALLFVLALSLAATLVFALAPALLAWKLDLDQALRAGSKGATSDRQARRRIDLLIAAEVALAFVLLFSAGLFVSSYSRLRSAELGFDAHNLLTMRIVSGGNPRSTADARRQYFDRMFQKARNLGGIQSTALANGLPLDYPAGVEVARDGGKLNSLARVITPDYFHVMGMTLLQGRAFTEADAAGAPRVAIVNENLAHELFGNENPVGRRLELLPDGEPTIPTGSVEIVGLARNVKELGIEEVPFEDVYLPFAQNPSKSVYLFLKTSGRAETMASALRTELRAMDADGVLYDVATMDARLYGGLRGARSRLALVGLFAGLAILLAAVGVYGAVAFSTMLRAREFALRIALGAPPASIVSMTLGQTARLTAVGAGAGLGAALVLGRLLKSALYMDPHRHPGMIYSVSVSDPRLLGGAACLLLCVAALAGMTPAARASRVDPCESLRSE